VRENTGSSFSAEPKRWINVTAPVCASETLKPAARLAITPPPLKTCQVVFDKNNWGLVIPHIEVLLTALEDHRKTEGSIMSSVIEHYRLKMTEDDSAFFEELGQHMASFEKGIRKVPASILPTLARLFSFSVDELVGLKDTAAKRGPMPKL